jgi:hypothetical protein
MPYNIFIIFVLIFVDFFHFFFLILNVSPWFLCGLAGVAEYLTRELEIRFPIHGIMNAFEIVYPQYWL